MLNDKQTRFVTEYLVDLNATQAAIRAGYSLRTAGSIGQRLLTHVEIGPAIAAGKAAQLESAALSASRVLEELRRLSFSDVRPYFDELGNLRPLHLLTAEQGACIAGFEVIKKNAVAGDGKIDTVHKVKFWDKPRSLEMLAKHFALLVDVVKVEGADKLVATLQAGRLRAAALKAAKAATA